MHTSKLKCVYLEHINAVSSPGDTLVFFLAARGRREIFHVQNLSIATGLTGNLPFSSCISLCVFGCQEESFNYLVPRRLNEGRCAKVVKKVFSCFGSFTSQSRVMQHSLGKGTRIPVTGLNLLFLPC